MVLFKFESWTCSTAELDETSFNPGSRAVLLVPKDDIPIKISHSRRNRFYGKLSMRKNLSSDYFTMKCSLTVTNTFENFVIMEFDRQEEPKLEPVDVTTMNNFPYRQYIHTKWRGGKC